MPLMGQISKANSCFQESKDIRFSEDKLREAKENLINQL